MTSDSQPKCSHSLKSPVAQPLAATWPMRMEAAERERVDSNAAFNHARETFQLAEANDDPPPRWAYLHPLVIGAHVALTQAAERYEAAQRAWRVILGEATVEQRQVFESSNGIAELSERLRKAGWRVSRGIAYPPIGPDGWFTPIAGELYNDLRPQLGTLYRAWFETTNELVWACWMLPSVPAPPEGRPHLPVPQPPGSVRPEAGQRAGCSGRRRLRAACQPFHFAPGK